MIYINTSRDFETVAYDTSLDEIIRNNINNSEGKYPGSDTMRRLLSNPKHITSSSIKYLYSCLKFYEDNGIIGGKQYNDIYDIIRYYERRLLK